MTVLVLGGAGLVGFQVACQVGCRLRPDRLVVAARRQTSAERAATALRELVPEGVEVVAEAGDLFVRREFGGRSRRSLLDDGVARRQAFADVFGPVEEAAARSALAGLIAAYRPEVIVDAVNTATAISYQDVYSAARQAWESGRPEDVEAALLSLPTPQLVRHVVILHRAMQEAGTRLYLKVGTTGTGGMGIDIPYTHSEDRPSEQILTKTATAFAHTGLLLLLARARRGPVVKEIKPAAMIGYSDVSHAAVVERGEPVLLYEAQRVPLHGLLSTRRRPDQFTAHGPLEVPVVDTGENGLFARGEFGVITAPGQMEFVTPEEIAALCVAEIEGHHTGRDVIGAVNSAILGPSYRAGTLRAKVLAELAGLEEEHGVPSVALGQLGPPELGKLLWEAELLRLAVGDAGVVLRSSPQVVAFRVAELLNRRPELRDTVCSVGLAVLEADGEALWQGPRMRIPEGAADCPVAVDAASRERWAARGWVDLRPANWATWQERLRAMRAVQPAKALRGSAAAGSAPGEELDSATMVAWILGNPNPQAS